MSAVRLSDLLPDVSGIPAGLHVAVEAVGQATHPGA